MIQYFHKQIPKGVIALWYGSVGTIPAGWALCNGAGGTPDLRDRFIIGAGLAFDPGDTGGTIDHTHTGTTDGHTHSIGSSSYMYGADPGMYMVVISVDAATGSSMDDFTTDATDNLPPYHALAYIMKL